MEHDKLKNLHIIVLFVLATAGVLFAVLSDMLWLWRSFIIALLWLSVFVVGNLVVYKSDRYRKFAILTFAAEVLLLFWLGSFNSALSVKILICVTIIDCFILFSGYSGCAFAVTSFLIYILQYSLGHQQTYKSILVYAVNEYPLFLLASLISYLIGKILKSNAIIERSMKAAQAKQIDLNNAYYELNLAYSNLEEISALRERNRIAREIHDTVGHTITTIIVEMEAGRMLLSKEPERAYEKFIMAHAQARRALDELRASVRLLASEERLVDLNHEAIEIADDTSAHTGVLVKCDINLPEKVDGGVAALVLRILKEGLSNGIRHGRSTAFFLKLCMAGDNLELLLQDNGLGCSKIEPGFGLTNMGKSVYAVGGTVTFSSEVGEGFEIALTLPLKKGEADGNDQGDAG